MIGDLGNAVAEFAEPYTVRTTDAGTLGSDGFFRTGTVTERVVQLVWWPANGREIAQLPEGERGNDTIGYACTSELFAASAPAGRPGERIVIDGVEWIVTKTFPWGKLGNFWAGMAQKVGQ